MTTININVSGITVVVNGETIDINPTIRSQHAPQQPINPYSTEATYQPFNFNSEQPRYFNPRFSNNDPKVTSSNPEFADKANPVKTMAENYDRFLNEKFSSEYDYRSYNGPTFNSDQLFKMLRELPESFIYMSENNSVNKPTLIQLTTQTISLETIKYSKHNTCLIVVNNRDDKKIEYTWCKAGVDTWIYKQRDITLEDMQLNKNY